MTALEAVELADEFLLEFDPSGEYDPQQTRLVAMAILFGEKRGLLEGQDLALGALESVRQEFAIQ